MFLYNEEWRGLWCQSETYSSASMRNFSFEINSEFLKLLCTSQKFIQLTISTKCTRFGANVDLRPYDNPHIYSTFEKSTVKIC